MTSITELTASVLTNVEELRDILKADNDGLVPNSFFETFENTTRIVKELKKANKKGKKSGSDSDEPKKEKKEKVPKKAKSDDEETEAPKELKEKKEKAPKEPKEKKEKKEKVPKEEKAKRPPSRYNLFLKAKMAEMKAEDESSGTQRSSQARMKDAVAMWNEGAKDTFKVESEEEEIKELAEE
jgi:hypothetical protein